MYKVEHVFSREKTYETLEKAEAATRLMASEAGHGAQYCIMEIVKYVVTSSTNVEIAEMTGEDFQNKLETRRQVLLGVGISEDDID